MLNNSQKSFDREHIWHPYTSLLDPLPVYAIDSAHGVRLQTEDGQELVDGMSSWWCAIHGYNVEELNEAIKAQTEKMAHVMFGGITHEPAVTLCQKLVSITPDGLDRVFLCDSGSISVEVAMKMAIQYQQSLGHPDRHQFLTIRKGYHGDTLGAMSVCDPIGGMHHLFADYMPKQCFIDPVESKFDGELLDQDLTNLRAAFTKNGDHIAAFILEPIVQGAGGMRFYHPDYLKEVRSLCDAHGVLLIADEIATGFGRTGKLFACEWAEISPDIMCLGKALTGGYMTLAATLATKKVAETICRGEAGVFMHGPTFMANPLACNVAGASIDLLLHSPWMENVQCIEKICTDLLAPLREHQEVADVRVLGAIAVVETRQPIDVANIQRYFVSQGVWIRPFRNLIYIMPPYIMNKEDLSLLCTAIRNSLDKRDSFR